MTLRELIIDWLTASRYVKWLEARHYETRQDYETRLSEKDEQIKALRVEVAWLRMQTQFAAQPVAQATAKPPVVPAFSGPDDWSAELNKLYEEEDRNGIRSDRRKEIHEQTADDGA
jgi:hypothetical protein